MMETKEEGTEALAGLLRARGYDAQANRSIVRIPADETPLKSLEDARLIQEHGFRAVGFDESYDWYIYEPEVSR